MLIQAVLVNLRFDNPDTRRLGLEGHVCELQLLLQQFAELQVCRTSL